ncbi:FMN-linked oxidoreductase [Fomes fomentarius]|nr:FMN-linked oxidoreductase [Fomes fomentarius]
MSRRSHPPSPDSSPRLAKKPRLEYGALTPEDYKHGLMLAPMVRSGALPTRLFALKHGAKLVWGPETVDKAILHTTRVVDPVTGVVSYHGKSRAIFTTHPIEKPFLIYQIGSADPDIAVQAAKMVQQDVSGFDLNCGDAPEITISAKIRLLPSQEDTLKLVERVVNTGISALTVHCRTRNMRMNEKAKIERLREIVEFVQGLGKGIAVIENGDCLGYEDSKRVREVTGAHSVMIATAAEANPSCFSPTPLKDLELTFVPPYIRLCKYLDNHWGSTKFCAAQFKGQHENASRADLKAFREAIAHSKSYDDMEKHVAPWTGEQEFAEIVEAIEKRGGQRAPPIALEPAHVAPAIGRPTDTVGEGVKEDTGAQKAEGDALPSASYTVAPTAMLGLDVPSPTAAEAIAVQ